MSYTYTTTYTYPPNQPPPLDFPPFPIPPKPIPLTKEDAVEKITALLSELASEETENPLNEIDSDTSQLTLADFLIKREKLLKFYVTKLVTDILVYCNRRDFPEPLIYTVVELIQKRIENQISAADSDESGLGNAPLSEIKMDDTTFKFAVNNVDLSAVFGEELFKSITAKLNLYRKVRSY